MLSRKRVLFLILAFLSPWADIDCSARAQEVIAEDGGSTQSAKPSQFLRLNRKGSQPISLDTAITSYRNDAGLQVDLVGAIHVGERSYYEKLNQRIDSYEVVLYELVAPEGTVIPRGGKRDGASNPISMLQGSMQSLLGLESQLEQIDYTRKTFVRADMTPEQIATRMKERGDTALTVTLSAMADILREQNLASQASEPQPIQSDFSVMDLFGDPTKLKQMMANQFAASGSLDQTMGKTLNQMLIVDRNAEALKGLTRQMAEGKKKIAIFYGAAHLPDFEKHLIADYGLRPVKQEWIAAWDLQKSQRKGLDSPLQLLESLFGDDE